MTTTSPLLLAALLAALAPAAGAAPAARCEATVSGSAKASFGCVPEIHAKDGKHYFVLKPTDAIEGVKTYQPGAFELPGPPSARTYTLDDLGLGLATFPGENKTLFTSSKTELNRRGEVTLTLTSAKKDRKGSWTVHGTYRARLIPAGAGKTGEVLVEAAF